MPLKFWGTWLMDSLQDQPINPIAELAKLHRQVEELRQAVRARDNFIVIAAHELRNPMTPIIGLTELALKVAREAEGNCPPRVTALLERLENVVADYMKMATRLLDVSRLDAGNFRLHPTTTDLSTLVRSVAQRYEVAAAHQGCSLEYDIENEICGIWDPIAIEQIVENLLSNALKFGAGKPVRLRLRAETGSVRLEVRDRGIGMSPEHQARIFERFEQIIGDHRGSGFGIGLWVVNRLASAMEGHIAVSSRLDRGSTFTVMLPWRRARHR
jgi:two-component system, OmpR family, sensor kinase